VTAPQRHLCNEMFERICANYPCNGVKLAIFSRRDGTIPLPLQPESIDFPVPRRHIDFPARNDGFAEMCEALD
jgi:hypothetical protein